MDNEKMADAMSNRRTRTLITEELYNKVKPLVDLFGNKREEYKTKILFYKAATEFIANYIGVKISTSTVERMLESIDWESYKEISKKANPHSEKNASTEENADGAEQNNKNGPVDFSQSAEPAPVVRPSFMNKEAIEILQNIHEQLYVAPSDFARTIGEQITQTGMTVGCIKKNLIEIVKEEKTQNKTITAFLDDLTTSMCDIRIAIVKMATELSGVRIATEGLLKEWQGKVNEEENKEENN